MQRAIRPQPVLLLHRHRASRGRRARGARSCHALSPGPGRSLEKRRFDSAIRHALGSVLYRRLVRPTRRRIAQGRFRSEPSRLACHRSPRVASANPTEVGMASRQRRRNLSTSLGGDPPSGSSDHESRVSTDLRPDLRGPAIEWDALQNLRTTSTTARSSSSGASERIRAPRGRRCPDDLRRPDCRPQRLLGPRSGMHANGPEHPNVRKGCDLVRSWPNAYTQLQLLIDSVNLFLHEKSPYDDEGWARCRARGGVSSG